MSQSQPKPAAEAALVWAEQGLFVFPVRPRDKRPAIGGWQKHATTDPATVRRMFAARPTLNIGIVPGRSGHVAIDLDTPDAETALRELLGGEIPPTLCWRTGRDGGRHLLYKLPDGVELRSRNAVGPGLDLKSTGGYVLVPTSTHPSGAVYTFDKDAPFFSWDVAELSPDQAAALEQRAGPPRTPIDPEQLKHLRAPSIDHVRSAMRRLRNDARFDSRESWIGIAHMLVAACGPESIEHMRALFHGFTMQREDYDHLECEHVLDTLPPTDGTAGGYARLLSLVAETAPLSDEERAHIEKDRDEFVERVAPKAEDEFEADPELEPEPEPEQSVEAAPSGAVEEPEPEQQNAPKQKSKSQPTAKYSPDTLRELEALNEEFAVQCIGGDVKILRQYQGQLFFMNASAFKLWLQNRDTVLVGQRHVSLANAWLSWPGRRDYSQMGFWPGEQRPDDNLNLWNGWAVEPSGNGSCEIFLQHLRENVCHGNEKHFQWLLDWIADIVQRPQRKLGFVVALQGAPGTGKSIVGATLKHLLGKCHVTASLPDHVGGRFNGHMETCLLLQAEECFWSGDRKIANQLKHIATGETLLIERKNIDAVERSNFTRILVTSNASSVWFTQKDDRRLVIFRLSDAHANDVEFFGAMVRELENGGYEKLLHVLLTREIDEQRIHDAPVTEALGEQSARSLEPEEKWLRELLTESELPASARVFDDGFARVPLASLYDEYLLSTPQRSQLGVQAFSHFLSRELPMQRTGNRPRVLSSLKGRKIRTHEIELPPLRLCREAYASGSRAIQGIWDDEPDAGWVMAGSPDEFDADDSLQRNEDVPANEPTNEPTNEPPTDEDPLTDLYDQPDDLHELVFGSGNGSQS